jgi:hypothetical protein
MTRIGITPHDDVIRRAFLSPFSIAGLGLLFTFGAQAEPLSFFRAAS